MSFDTFVEYIFDHHSVDVQLILRIRTSCRRHSVGMSLVYHDRVVVRSSCNGTEVDKKANV